MGKQRQKREFYGFWQGWEQCNGLFLEGQLPFSEWLFLSYFFKKKNISF